MTKRSQTEENELTESVVKDGIKYTVVFSIGEEVAMRGHYSTLTDLKTGVYILGDEWFDALQWDKVEEGEQKTFTITLQNKKLVCTLH
jgi:hypothetical protein